MIKLLKHTLILITLLGVCSNNVKSEETFFFQTANFPQDDNYFLHTIERGETVYSIATMYNVSTEDIFKHNPTSKDGIRAGNILVIPQKSASYYYHTIQPKETLYSVSKKYNMKGEDIIAANVGLSVQTFTIGKTIRIPTNTVTTPMEPGNENNQKRETEALLTAKTKGNDIKMIKVALLLPFGLNEGTNSYNAQSNRFVEYYEGFLMSLDQLKKSGISVDLQVYDIGNEVAGLTEILKKETIQDVNLLIGGLNDKQIKLISTFAKEKQIPYVIPFTSKSDEPLNNPYIFQINTPRSYLYSKTSAAFNKEYRNKQVIFFISDPANEKMEFINILKNDLDQNGESYKSISYSDRFFQELRSQLLPDKLNVIIPSDDSSETLRKISAPLKMITESNPESKISIFGYPEWQVYSGDYMEDYFKLKAGFYSIFYANPTSMEVKNFHSNFQKWYSRGLINTFPKFGILGYDTGMFFIKGLEEFGTALIPNINKVKYNGIQTDFKFERINNWSGFINTNIYIISFNSDFSISKNAFK